MWIGIMYVPSNFLNDLTNESSLLGKGTLSAGDAGLGVTKGNSAVALVEPVGKTFIVSPVSTSALSDGRR